jgi:hypothetical protein
MQYGVPDRRRSGPRSETCSTHGKQADPMQMNSRRPPLELYRLIESLAGNPEAQRRLREDREAMFDAFALPAAHRAALRGDVRAGLAAIGAHPNMQFKYLAAIGHLSLKPASVADYLERAKERHGTNR